MSALELLGSERVVAIVRATSAKTALAAARAAQAGGMQIVEVTMNTPGAVDVIGELAAEKKGLVGAGTVLDKQTADAVLAAGARLIVSPHADPELIRHVLDKGGLPVPGALTATEVLNAIMAGAPVVKIFPVGCVGGPEYIKMLRGPFGTTRFMVTGGITADNVKAYLAAGAYAAGFTGGLFPADLLERGDWDAIRTRAADLLARLKS